LVEILREHRRRLHSRPSSVTAGPVSEDPKKRAAVFRLSNAVLGSRRGVFFTRSIAGRGVVRLRPGLRWLEFTPRRWWRGRARKWQGSSLLPRSSRRHISKRRSRREIVPNRLRHKQPLSQLNQSIHSLIPSPISHIDQISKIRDCIVESGIAQLLEQAALQLDRDLLQGDNGDGVAALEGCFSRSMSAGAWSMDSSSKREGGAARFCERLSLIF
jgi:hypothetical protein